MMYGQYRCKGCNKLLFKGVLVDSTIEVKCKRCGEMNEFHGLAKDALLCFKPNCVNRVTREKALAEGKEASQEEN